MTDLERRLELLGLAQYYNVFLQEGFDTWDTLADITESDLNFLEVKLGHRRKLQRAIAGSRGNPDSRGNSVPLPISLQNHSSTDTYYNTDESAGEQRQRQPASSVASASGINTKRKYRRHPKADEHAPERPPSAYVIFSNMVRERLKDENLSFTEIAKKVGEMWQVLDPQERERCEHQAAEAKRDYKEKMEEYKKTAEYEAYQRYLEEFKRKHGLPQKEGKRTKMGSDADPPVRSETASRSTSRYVPILHTDHSGARPSVPEPSPTVMSGWFASAPSYPSMSNSPSLGPLSLDSPRTANPYSPTTASPATVTSKRESSFEPQYQHSAFGRESEGQPDRTAGYGTPRPAFGHMIPPAPASPISTQPLSVYPPSGDLRPRRPYRESLQLPPLTHEDTTYSSHESSHSGSFSAPPPRPQYLPSISDVTKSTPILPQLGPTIARTAPMPDRSMLLGASAAHGDHRRNSSLAALAEASEIARGADAEQPEPSRPP